MLELRSISDKQYASSPVMTSRHVASYNQRDVSL
jgi:hypothetical protein